jgi:glutamate dehydrogenase/leucine dehydrogenase
MRDGLRLSLGMGRKNSLAGLHWGGGKGILLIEDNKKPQSEYVDTMIIVIII